MLLPFDGKHRDLSAKLDFSRGVPLDQGALAGAGLAPHQQIRAGAARPIGQDGAARLRRTAPGAWAGVARVRHGATSRRLSTVPASPERRPHLSPGQAQAFLDAARGERLEAFYSVAIACGVRRGEALALLWSDVDLSAGTLHVARTLSRTRAAGLTFTEPKTVRSRRTLPLPGPCVEQLRAHRVRQAGERLKAGGLWVVTQVLRW